MIHISDMEYIDLIRVGTAREHRDITYLATWKQRYLFLATSQTTHVPECKMLYDLAKITLDNNPKLTKGSAGTYYNTEEMAQQGMALVDGKPCVVDQVRASQWAKSRREGLKAYRKRKAEEKEADNSLVKEAKGVFYPDNEPKQAGLL